MKDQNLDQLILSVKTEAIDAAEQESNELLDEARRQAKTIREEAEKEKQEILSRAEKEAEAIVRKGKIALQQAARDMTLALQQDLLKMFHQVFEQQVRKTFTPDLMRSVIVPVIENVGKDVEIQLPAETAAEVADFIRREVRSGDEEITVRSDGALSTGMKIRKTAEGWSYEITPETIAAALQPSLTETWINILQENKST